ncbi:hypothetical protein PISMIDRAFT_19844 [Pisolithus microcarpus 441]|uniref:Reverse transcriptase Ty1/copia-type domain-containing protein n=1 Tax=Pisolithus microcarpus 441 TaxID=765257 RepID=A0A0C9XFL7_9AGAM|nr:hypothetical protein PISMIDRAFT_19844 [Pisolithus microcarpus 441]
MFAPITKFSTIRVLLALAAQHDLEIHQMDIKSTFLNGELDEEIYLKLPPGFHGTGDKVKDGVIIIIVVYIDDKLILSKCTRAIKKLKEALMKEYDLLDLGEARWILGMEII